MNLIRRSLARIVHAWEDHEVAQFDTAPIPDTATLANRIDVGGNNSLGR